MRKGALLFSLATLLLALSAGVALAATLFGTDAADNLGGTAGKDGLLGRGGDGGKDVIYGGSGGDLIFADDGLRYAVSCGGTDTFFVDPLDHVAPGCEVYGPSALRGGVLATFEASGERFRVWIVNHPGDLGPLPTEKGPEHRQHS